MAREIYVLSGMAIVVALGFGILSPAIPLLADQFGVDHAIAGLAISAFAAARFLSAFANGRLVERISERPVLIAGLFLQAVMMVIAAGAPNYWVVIGARAVAGVGSAAFTVSSLSMVLRLARPESRGRAASIYQGGFLIGAVGGPAIGGVLTDITPRLPFLVYGICLALAGLAVVLFLPSEVADQETPEHFADPVLAEHNEEGQDLPFPISVEAGHPADHPAPLGLKSRAFLAALAINLANGWLLYGVRNSLLPAFVKDELHHTAVWFGAASFVASIAQVAVLMRAGVWTDTWGRRPTMVIGAAASLLSAVLLVLPAQTGLFVLSMLWMGVAAAFLSSSPAAVVGDVSQGAGGRGIALFSMASDFGGVTGPLLAGLLADEISYTAAFASCVVVCALAVGACLIMQETRIKAPAAPAAGGAPAQAPPPDPSLVARRPVR
jgi:MFS family permease